LCNLVHVAFANGGFSKARAVAFASPAAGFRGLSDGSYLSELFASSDRRRSDGVAVRVIEYQIEDPGRPHTEERYRLLTTILDPEHAPATELAPLYAQRWEFEGALDELKVHQRGPASYCAPRPPTASSRRSTATSACTTRSAG
jgi:hypothetical protein